MLLLLSDGGGHSATYNGNFPGYHWYTRLSQVAEHVNKCLLGSLMLCGSMVDRLLNSDWLGWDLVWL